MDDNIIIPRSSVETLIRTAHQVLELAEPPPAGCSRVEVTTINNRREQLKGAVYNAEKAIYEKASKPLNVDRMSNNAERLRPWDDDFYENKANFIEGRR